MTQPLVDGFIAGAAYGLLAGAFALVYNATRTFYVAGGVVFTVTAYSAWFVRSGIGLPRPAAMLVGAASGIIVGLVIEVTIDRPLRLRSAAPMVNVVAGLGLLIVVQNVVGLMIGEGLVSIAAVQEPFTLGTVTLTPARLAVAIVSVVLTLVLHLTVRRSGLGRWLRAIGQDPFLVRVIGGSERNIMLAGLTIAAGIAAVAALLFINDTDLRPSMGFEVAVVAVISVLVGGTRNIIAAWLGGVVFGLCQSLVTIVAPAIWQDTFTFVFLLVLLVVRPEGPRNRAPLAK